LFATTSRESEAHRAYPAKEGFIKEQQVKPQKID